MAGPAQQFCSIEADRESTAMTAGLAAEIRKLERQIIQLRASTNPGATGQQPSPEA